MPEIPEDTESRFLAVIRPEDRQSIYPPEVAAQRRAERAAEQARREAEQRDQ